MGVWVRRAEGWGASQRLLVFSCMRGSNIIADLGQPYNPYFYCAFYLKSSFERGGQYIPNLVSDIRILQIQGGIMTYLFRIIVLVLSVSAACGLIESINSVSTQYVPVSKRYPGLDLPGDNAVVTVELVYDLTCDYTSEFDKIFRQVVSSLAQSHPGKFTYRYAFQSLPYHITSFKVTEAVRYVNDKKGPAAALEVVRYFLDTVSNWGEVAFLKTTVSGIMTSVARQVSTLTGLDYDDIRKQIMHYSANDNETRKWVKYAMGTLHVSSTPTVFTNGARIDGAAGMSAQKMIDYLTGLL